MEDDSPDVDMPYRKGKGRGGKGKGNRKGGKRSSPPMPKQLLGGWSQTSKGRPICFDYNLDHGCPKAKAGQACSKGLHVCCMPRCQQPHPMHAHPSVPPGGADKHQ